MNADAADSRTSPLRPLALLRGLHARVRVGRFWHAVPFAAVGVVAARRGWPTLGEGCLLLFCLVFGRGLVVSAHRALAAPAALPDSVDVSEGAPPPRAIWWAFALHAALGLGFSAWLLNPTAGYLSLVPTVAILAAAALRKRTAFAHVLLGAGLAAAPPGAYYALTGACDVGFYGATMFGCGVLAWAAGLDVLWSLQPRFRTPGAPAAFPYPMSVGRLEARSLARLVQLAALAFFASARATLGFDRFYLIGVGAAAACLLVAHRRQRAPDAADVGPEFLRWNLAVGPCLFVGALLGL